MNHVGIADLIPVGLVEVAPTVRAAEGTLGDLREGVARPNGDCSGAPADRLAAHIGIPAKEVAQKRPGATQGSSHHGLVRHIRQTLVRRRARQHCARRRSAACGQCRIGTVRGSDRQLGLKQQHRQLSQSMGNILIACS
ncbi:hypothetical protein D3C72_669830 [compost metagenome]